MIKLFFFIKRKPGTTHEYFRARYASHVILGREYFGDIILDARRSYPITIAASFVDEPDGLGSPAEEPQYDAITELTLRDQDALDEMFRRFRDPEVRRIISEDEAQFMDRDTIKMMRCDEVVSWSQL